MLLFSIAQQDGGGGGLAREITGLLSKHGCYAQEAANLKDSLVKICLKRALCNIEWFYFFLIFYPSTFSCLNYFIKND